MKIAIITAAILAVSAVNAAKCTKDEQDLVDSILLAEEAFGSCDWTKSVCNQSDACHEDVIELILFTPDCESKDGTNYWETATKAALECDIDPKAYNKTAPPTKYPVTTVPPTKYPVTTVPAPYPTSTPAYQPARKCWAVSVEKDATYCIDGPICSGSGDKPAGTNCPKKGAVAIADCKKNLKSWVDADKCVLPVDSVCTKIKTGAWGCTLDCPPLPTPPYTTTPPYTATPKPTTPCPTTAKPTPCPTTVTPCPTTTKPAYTTAPPTPCPTTPKPTPCPTTATPCPTTAKPTPCPTTVTPCPTTTKPAYTTAPPTPCPTTPTPCPTTAKPTPCPTTATPCPTTTKPAYSL